MAEDHVVTTAEGAITTITLNRVAAKNAITRDMGAAMLAALSKAAADPAMRVVVFRANGADFSIGRDAGGPPAGAQRAVWWRNSAYGFLNLYRAIEAAPIPVVAAVHGAVYSTGCAIASACDITIAADDARFCLTDMRDDIPPLLVMSAMLRPSTDKNVGFMAYTAADVDAEMARLQGLVSQVVPRGRLDATVDGLVAKMAKNPRPALAAIKQYVRYGGRMDGRSVSDYAASMMATVISSAPPAH